MHTQRTTVDAYSGTVRDLLNLLRTLHNGTAPGRLDAIDRTCERIADLRAKGVTL